MSKIFRVSRLGEWISALRIVVAVPLGLALLWEMVRILNHNPDPRVQDQKWLTLAFFGAFVVFAIAVSIRLIWEHATQRRVIVCREDSITLPDHGEISFDQITKASFLKLPIFGPLWVAAIRFSGWRGWFGARTVYVLVGSYEEFEDLAAELFRIPAKGF